MTKTKNILLIGRTGKGKSTLANVLSSTNKFEESADSVSKTKEIQSVKFDPEQYLIESLINEIISSKKTKDKKNLFNKLKSFLNKLKEKLTKTISQKSESHEDKKKELDTIKFISEAIKEENFANLSLFLDEQDSQKIQNFLLDKDKMNYCIIDTPGIGDTNLRENEVLDVIAEAVYLVRNGVSQVFFVTGGRFDQSETFTYDLLRTIIFDNDITNYTTIVRTNFEGFRNSDKCKEDTNEMINEGGELAKIVNSCQGRIVHVNNPPIKAVEFGNKEDEARFELYKIARVKSRKRLLDHLSESCQSDYKPEKLQNLSAEIVEFMEKKRQLKEKLKNKKQILELGDEKAKEFKIIRDIAEAENNKNGKDTKDDSRLIAEKKEEQIDEDHDDIKKLEDKIRVLKEAQELGEKIQKIDEDIREIVRRHILNIRNSINPSEQGLNELMAKFDELIKERQEQGIDERPLEQIEKELLELKKQLLISNKKIAEKWLVYGFNNQKAQEWAEVLGNDFNPEDDAIFCAWLKNSKQLTVEEIKESSIEKLRKEHTLLSKKETKKLDSYYQQLSLEEEKSPAQRWLDKNYPKEKRSDIEELDTVGENLEGDLEIIDFPDLERIHCQSNQLTSLVIKNCPNLIHLDCSWNKIANLTIRDCPKIIHIDVENNKISAFDIEHPERIVNIYARKNNFPQQDLSTFNEFVNLERLKLEYNSFYGSLEPLSKLPKLKELDVSYNAEIDSGLEFLLEGLERIYCRGTKLEEILKPYDGDIKKWRKSKQESAVQIQTESTTASTNEKGQNLEIQVPPK